MASEIRIPRLGWTMEEGAFVGWLKHDGDAVAAGEPLFTLEGDKATQDVEAVAGGILRTVSTGPLKGDLLKVGAVIGWIVAPGEEPPRETLPPRDAPRSVSSGAAPPAASLLPSTSNMPPRVKTAGEVRPRIPAASPRAVRIASELGVDWTFLEGTGRNGRIRAKDVLSAAGRAAPALTPLRKAIAARLSLSAQRTVPVTLTREADATALAAWRTGCKQADGSSPTITDVFIRLAAGALHDHPEINAVWRDAGLAASRSVHICIAVDTERGLVAPVLRDAEQLKLSEITVRSRELAERARSGRLKVEELEGGTFTITNLGGLGIDAFTPVVNHPQVAILGIGRLREQPVVHDGRVEARKTIWLSFTFDHRALDGAPAARFLDALCRRMEDPGSHLEGLTP